MAACTHGASGTTTANNASPLATASFTPAANDLLVCCVAQAGALTGMSLSDSQGGSWTLAGSATRGGTDTISLFVRDSLVSASAMTVTATPAGSGTGMVIAVGRVSGMTKTGATAIKQFGKVDSTGAGTIPTVPFAGAVQTGNPTLAFIGNQANPAACTEPVGWTEQLDTGHATPSRGLEYATRDSGFTGSTITWGAASPAAWGTVGVELDASAGGTTFNSTLSGAITPAGAVVNKTTKVLAGSSTPAGALVNKATKVLSGAVSPSATLATTKLVLSALAGAITPSGALLGKATKVLGGAVTPAGAVVKLLSRALAGVASPSGALVKQTGKVLVAGIAPAATVVMQTTKILAGALTPSGALTGIKLVFQALVGALTPGTGQLDTTYTPAPPAGEPGTLTVYDRPTEHTKVT